MQSYEDYSYYPNNLRKKFINLNNLIFFLKIVYYGTKN